MLRVCVYTYIYIYIYIYICAHIIHNVVIDGCVPNNRICKLNGPPAIELSYLPNGTGVWQLV